MQNQGLKRNTLDKFYTKTEVAMLCVEYVKKHICINQCDLIIEPSVGSGSFVSGINSIGCDSIFIDLEPEFENAIKHDFLTWDYRLVKNIEVNKRIHIIGNPPFGRQSSLARKFIKRCCLFADTISFILPSSFKKESLQKSFDLNFHLIFETELPKNSFRAGAAGAVGELECDIPCVFQIWEKRNIIRECVDKQEPNGFCFVKKEDSPDVSFRRVGFYAGEIDKLYQSKSIQSHYFIKFTNEYTVDENIEKLRNVSFKQRNTVGPKSISKSELIFEFNKYI